jgi:hypothetical protein
MPGTVLPPIKDGIHCGLLTVLTVVVLLGGAPADKRQAPLRLQADGRHSLRCGAVGLFD